MEAQTTITQVNNFWQASMITFLSPIEINFVEAYGEPQINLGGTFSYTKGLSTLSFTLPTKMAGIRNGIPFVQGFDGNTDPDASLKVAAWNTAILAELTTAKDTLLALPTPVSPDITYTVL